MEPVVRCNVKLNKKKIDEVIQEMFKDIQKLLGQDKGINNEYKAIIKPIQISSLEILSEREILFCYKDMTKLHTLKL